MLSIFYFDYIEIGMLRFEPPEKSNYTPFIQQQKTKKYSTRTNPYRIPTSENVKTGIRNQETLIEDFYTNVSISIKEEESRLIAELKVLSNTLSPEQKTKLDEDIHNIDDIRQITFRGIDGIVRRNDIPNDLKRIVLLLIIIYKLKEIIIEPAILDDSLRPKRTNRRNEGEYLEYLRRFFDKIAKPYKDMLNIRNAYNTESIYDIEKLERYSKFLVGYANYAGFARNTLTDAIIPSDFTEYIKKEYNTLNAKINRHHYKVYYAPLERSGGKSKSKSNRIKELCKANQIKLSRIIDGKRVVYKMKELITKLKRKKIQIS
jgi:hypothetical protein